MSDGERPRVRVKICGVTNREDALGAIEAGADALGFNLWPGSKRHMLLEQNAAWMRALPPFVTRVAVLVNATLEEARQVAEHPAIDLVQFHGDERPEFLEEFARVGRPFIVALRVGEASRFPSGYAFPTPYLLIDAAVPGAYGGTGHAIDLQLGREFIEAHPGASVILAGGLTPENVAAAVAGAKPYAVDVASGVEAAPGRKDLAKMRAFIAALRN